MILEGTISIFDTRDNDGYVFTKETKLTHPKKDTGSMEFRI